MRKLTLLKKVTVMVFFAFALSTLTAYAQADWGAKHELAKWELVTPKYATHDVFVAAINVMDHGADPTGATDQTALFQRLLDDLGSRQNGRVNDAEGNKIAANANRNGGVLFVPEGKYLFNTGLIIPKGVTIRGEWEKPVKGQPIKGTILMPTRGRGSDATVLVTWEGWSFLTLQPSSAVMDLNIWYPDQKADNIVPYPPAIMFGQQGFWGNDYCLASNITLVNAFDGIIVSRRAGGGAPNTYGIYGTPLRRGIEIDNIAEIGRVDNIDFSAEYWAGSGLPNSPSVDGPLKNWLYNNATALVMRRNDWSFIGKVKAEGYKIGYRCDYSFNADTNTGQTTPPNGHNFSMEFTNCKYGVYAVGIAGAGMMFYDYKFNNCEVGFYFEDETVTGRRRNGVVQILGCEFNATEAALYAPVSNTTKILMAQNTINSGAVDIRGYFATIVNNTFNNPAEQEQIRIGTEAKVVVTGNKFKNDANILCVSKYETIIDHTPIEMTELPEFPYKNQYAFNQRPAGNAFILATNPGGGFTAVSAASDDNSDALQALLNKAKADGGGLVYLIPGRFKFRKPITIPTGVELKGSVDVPSVPTGPGTSMEIYAGKGDENGTPFITMEPGSGIRGLVMNYPEQRIQLLTDPSLNGGKLFRYPYCIRGNKDVYIVNIGLRAVMHGVDLFTNKCDNHFVDYLAGHVFETGIRVGGGSKDGHVYNAQFNQIAYGSGGETKFGAWPNSPDNERLPGETQEERDIRYSKEHTAAYAYCWNHLDFIMLGNCEDQIMYNNFCFGSNRGFVLSSIDGKENGPSGLSLGQGIDQGMKAMVFEASKGFDFINSQIVTTPANSDVLQIHKEANRYFQTTPDFDGKKVTFFAACFWGQTINISNELLGGTIELQMGNYSSPGNRNFATVADGAEFDLIATNVNNISNLVTAESNPNFFVQSSMLNNGNVNLGTVGLWVNNINFTFSAVPDACAFMDRTGWIATASHRNENAPNSLDGNTTTVWNAGTNQTAGQWFMVDMLEEQTFTGILMDPQNNTRPAEYAVSVSNNGTEWTQVTIGRNSNEVNFEVQKARYVRIELRAGSTTVWRIAEFYLMNTWLPDVNVAIENIISPDAAQDDVKVWFAKDQLNILGTTGNSIVKIYSISGQQVMVSAILENSISTNFSSGVYIVVVENNGNIYRKKVIKR
jgi:hypothetical protein